MWSVGPGACVGAGGSGTRTLSGAGWPAFGAGLGVPKVPRACPPAPSLSLCFRATWVSLAQEWPGTLLPSLSQGWGLTPGTPQPPSREGGGGVHARGPHLSVIASPLPLRQWLI